MYRSNYQVNCADACIHVRCFRSDLCKQYMVSQEVMCWSHCVLSPCVPHDEIHSVYIPKPCDIGGVCLLGNGTLTHMLLKWLQQSL